MQTKEDPRWLWSRRPGGVKYRFIIVNPAAKEWEIEIMSINDKSLKVKYSVPGSAVDDPSPYLLRAQFDFAKMQDERATRERERRKAQRDAQFPGAVQAGGEWQPERGPETDGSQETSADTGSGGDREDSAPVDKEDSGPSDGGMQSKSKAPNRKTRSSRKGRGQQDASKA
jgi:hypothetical protein